MKPLPNSPAELESQLASIFPAFAVKLDSDEEYPATYHSVLLFHFNSFFGKNVETFTPKQLKAFAELVTRCSAVPGDLENALDTCFLEHTKQMRVNKHLGKYLREAERADVK
jgi:hypothetical protein